MLSRNMLKIIGLKKSECHSSYILEKKQEFFKYFRKFLSDLDFGDEDSNVEIYGFGRPNDDQGEPIKSKEDNINDYSDQYFLFRSEGYVIDVIFGEERIFVIVSFKEDKQEEVNNKILKFALF